MSYPARVEVLVNMVRYQAIKFGMHTYWILADIKNVSYWEGGALDNKSWSAGSYVAVRHT